MKDAGPLQDIADANDNGKDTDPRFVCLGIDSLRDFPPCSHVEDVDVLPVSYLWTDGWHRRWRRRPRSHAGAQRCLTSVQVKGERFSKSTNDVKLSEQVLRGWCEPSVSDEALHGDERIGGLVRGVLVATGLVLPYQVATQRGAGESARDQRVGAYDCREGAVVAEALGMLNGDNQPRLVTFGYSDDEAFAVGLTCGGIIHLFLQPLTW